MAKFLGIDYGARRIGLAVSDKDGILARPLLTLENNQSVANQIKDICQEEAVEKIIIGLPVRLKGGESLQTKEVKEFAGRLEKSLDLPIVFESEIFTTKIAREAGTKKVDERAAQIILQSFLDKQN